MVLKRHATVSAAILAAVLASPLKADFVTGLDATGDDFLALRSGPGTEFMMLSKLVPNTQVTVVESYENWRRVEVADGRMGWAYGRYIAAGSPLEDAIFGPELIGTDVYTALRASLRQGPDRGTERRAWLEAGSRLVVIDIQDGWVQVLTGSGQVGYVNTRRISLAPPVVAPTLPSGPTEALLQNWSTYENQSYGTRLNYPSDYFLPEITPAAGNGQAFSSVDGHASLIVAALPLSGAQTLEQLRQHDIENGSYDTITYQPVRDTWYVLSGYSGDNIFYRRVEFRAGQNTAHTFELRFPSADKGLMDNVVTRMSRAFADN
ncbi:MAG: SH3 domain-containing protein [Rhodobacter sp.]|nr:SH3 domain-containing protein [Rhodobacter sp.]